MVVNKIKKVNRYRGHSTHGGGARKKRRGSGSRGGKGRAGTGKRAGQKKAGIKDWTLGRTGFKPQNPKPVKAINIGYFTTDRINKLLDSGEISKEGAVIVLDLSKLGFDKLLGTGKVSTKFKVIVSSFSASVEKKVKAAGGEIVSN